MLLHPSLRKLITAQVMTLISVLTGILGYIVLEHYSLREAFYMTMLIISTVGFKEVRDLSPSGQVFTSFYILYNLATIAYLISVITKYIFEGELQTIFNSYMSEHDLKKVQDHVIVCGFGRNGSKACQELLACQEAVIVIEADENLIKTKLAAGEKINTILGDATQDEILKKAGIERAKAIITALPKDADNVFVTLTARELNKNIRIIARASDKSTEPKLLRAGANSVVMPDEIGGNHMANLVTRPDVIHFLEMMNGLGPQKLHLEEIECQNLQPNLQGKTLKELNILANTGVTVIGLRTRNKQFVVSPGGSTTIKPGDALLLLGTEDQLNSFKQDYRAPF